ncbi:salicylic acid-binding protein 2-like protein [Tanacetum coccineum]
MLQKKLWRSASFRDPSNPLLSKPRNPRSSSNTEPSERVQRAFGSDTNFRGTNTKAMEHGVGSSSNPFSSLPVIAYPPSISQHLEKVILVGHSLGGMNISLAMENFPKKISVAIFLTAFMPDTIHKPSYVFEQSAKRTPQDTWLDTQFLPYSDEESEVSMLFGPKFVSSKLYQLCSDEDRELGKILIRPGSLFLKDLPNAKQFTEEGCGSVRRVFVLCDGDETIKED